MSDPLTYSNFLKADPSASWVDYRDAVKAAVDLEKAHAQAHTNKRHQVISQNRIATLQSRLRGTGFADFEKRKETLMKHASQVRSHPLCLTRPCLEFCGRRLKLTVI
ncbi:hypothetical protein BC832DRAFT_401850 [Gaertneriomyces semiglobifer]|nr:hypothetical protein BC832DRAFT_401850 [Gaertneriomyces semiglobifer]